MLNPKNASKSPLSSRVALPIALMLAGIFGLGISVVQPTAISKNPVPTENPEPKEAIAPSENLASNPKTAEPAPAAMDLVAFCSRNVTHKRSFVVFKRGTCVVVNEPCEDPLAEARRILSTCKDANARFITETSNEGDLIVAFKDPVFHRFSPKELAKIQPWLKTAAAALLTPTESVAAGDGWTPPENAQVGLLARRRMLEDATSAVPVKIIRAKERSLASR
jgi:hypothetical protein